MRKGATEGRPAGRTWSHLNPLQVGRYAEYLFKMRFVVEGLDVYSAEVDDRGIDFVIRQEPDHYWDVQVKSIRNTGYVFIPQSKFRIRSNLLLALAIFSENKQPDLYIIPASEWQALEGPYKGILVFREYKGLKSPPEYGINLSVKGIKALENFRFESASKRIFTPEPSPGG